MENEQVLNFMQITECHDYNKATEYMAMANNNLENAVSLYMEIEAQQSTGSGLSQVNSLRQNSEEQKYVNEVNTQIFNQLHPPVVPVKQSSTPIPVEHQQRIEEYRKFLKERQDKEEGLAKRAFNGTIGIIKGLFKSSPKDCGAEFISYLKRNNLHTIIQFNTGNFLENLEKTNKNFKPILLYVHHHGANPFATQVLSNAQLASFVVPSYLKNKNKMYINLGFLSTAEQLIIMKELQVNIDKFPAFYVFRRDLFDKIITMNVYEVNPDMDFNSLIQRLKTDKAQFNKLFIIEEQIKNEAINPQAQREQFLTPQNQFFQPGYLQPPIQVQSQEQQLQRQQQQQKIQQERILREQQEAAYRQAELDAKRKKEQQRAMELEYQKLQEQQQTSNHQHEERLLKKATLMSNLPNEPETSEADVVIFQFRMPNGENLERRFKDTTQIQTLFDFISVQNDDYFENIDAQFDIIQNFPRLSLLEHTNELVKEVFVDSQMEQLIVKEL